MIQYFEFDKYGITTVRYQRDTVSQDSASAPYYTYTDSGLRGRRRATATHATACVGNGIDSAAVQQHCRLSVVH